MAFLFRPHFFFNVFLFGWLLTGMSRNSRHADAVLTEILPAP
jgi:hypothetical protein